MDRVLWICFLIPSLLLLGALVPSGRGQQPPVIAIEGGTLIDGNGGAPVITWSLKPRSRQWSSYGKKAPII